MTYETFQQEVLTALQRKHFNGITLELTQQPKRNSHTRYGIVFRNSRTNASPVIYLEEFYAYYQMTGNFPEIIDILTYQYSCLPVIQVDKRKVSDFSHVRDRIIMKLINTEKNRTFLEFIPHIPFNDLSIVFYLIIETDCNRIFDKAVDYEMLKEWGVNVETLHTHALVNYTRFFPIKLASIEQQFLDMGFTVKEPNGQKNNGQEVQMSESSNSGMYYLSNRQKFYGAVLITCKNLMDVIGNIFGENFYIIPCSLHEILLLPESIAPSKEFLDMTIQDANQSYLMPEEYLSDHAYYYSKSGQGSGAYFMQNLLLHSPGTIS